MTFPNFSFSQQAYSQGPGTTGMFWPVVINRDPTANDVFSGPLTFKVGQIWFNSTLKTLWYLNSFSNIHTSTNPTGQLQAEWIEFLANTTELLSLSDNANTQVFPSLTTDTPPSNIQFKGQLNEQVTPFSTTVADVAGHIIKINPMSPARWIVDPLSTTANPNGTHTTIQAALNAAGPGDTIMVMPGTYNETLTLKNECNLVAFNDDIAGTVIISGTLTLDNTATGTYFCVSGIRFQRTSGSCITHSGNEVRQLFLTRCKIIVQGTATGITFTNTAVNSEIRLSYCSGDASDAGSKIFAMSGTDLNSSVIGFYSSYFTNGGSTTVPSTTANTNSSGINEFYNSTFALPVTTSGNATLRAFDTDFSNMTGTTVGNVTNLIIGGSGVNKVTGCVLNSGSAVAATISTTTLMTSTTISSSNAASINGAGTLNYGDLVFTSGAVIGVTTQNNLNPTVAFSAYLSASTSNDKTGDGTVYTVICDTEIFDKGSNYNNATGVFTAPVPGLYFLSGAITCANYISGPFDNIVDFNCSTAGVFRVSRSYWDVAFNNPQQSFSVIVKLIAGETVTMRLTGNGGGLTEGVIGSASPFQTFFSGYLI